MRQKKDSEDTRSEKKVKKIRLYKFIAVTVLVLFLLGGFLLFENEITIENLRYMVKYLDFSSSGAFSEESVIYYNADVDNDFYVFRGDLALINPRGVTLFDRRGSAVMTDTFSMTKPTGVCGEKYLVIYDLGGHNVRVYNSFSLLYEESFDYAVQSVSINSDGAFCVVTAEKNYRSAVYVFDRNFEETYRWLSADKLASGAFLSDRNELSISAVHVQNGELISELIELKVGEKDPLSVFTLQGELPLMHRSERQNALLVTDLSFHILEKGKSVVSRDFVQGSILKVALSENRIAVLSDELSVGVNYKLSVFDDEGEEIRSHKFSETIQDLKVFDETVYVLTHTELFVFSEGKEMISVPLEEDYSCLGVLSEDCVILCGETKANIRILKRG